MDVVNSTLLFDEFTPLMDTDCTTFDEFDEILLKQEDTTDDFPPNINFNYDIKKKYFEMPVIEKTDFNPDEFLNYLQPDHDKLFFGERNTPSPTNSSTSSISSDTNSLNSNNNQNVIFDTPPISPGENNYNLNKIQLPIKSIIPTTLFVKQSMPILNENQVKLIQDSTKLIPVKNSITLSKSKTIQINGLKKLNNTKPKTIILSAKDFNNLIEHSKNQQNLNGNSIQKLIVKQNNNQCSKTLPKIAPQQLDIKNEMTTQILPNSFIDEKTFKKHQRMIKNRKSACLSRMKKKDYVSSLETKINYLEKENVDLKNENNLLRNRLEYCECNNNINNKNYNKCLNDKISTTTNPHNFIQKNNFNLNTLLMGSTLRKNTAVLLAMVFMISINVGTINTFLKPSISNDLKFHDSSNEHYGRRGLLWINESNTIINNNSNNFTNSIKPKALPLNHSNKNITIYPICPMLINQTENLRLASELSKWIGTNDYLNLSTITIGSLKYQTNYLKRNSELQTIFKDMENLNAYMKKNRKNYFNRSVLRKNKKSQKLNNNNNNNNQKTATATPSPTQQNPIEIYHPKLEDKYSKLFKEIRRRDDTFYVVSFNTDHILLPASAYNKTSRPKMSLMLPASDTMSNGKFTLMQIDCEVINTTLLQLKEEFIPNNLRPTNNNRNSNGSPNGNGNSNSNNNNNNNNNFKRSQDKNTTTSNFNLNERNFNNLTPTLNHQIKKQQQRQHNVNELNEFNKKTKFNIYKPYFLTTNITSSGRVNDVKINKDKFLP